MSQRVCPECGTRVTSKEAKFCPACGAPLAEEKQGRATVKKRGLLLLIGGLIALVAGFALLSGSGEEPEAGPPEERPVAGDQEETQDNWPLLLTAVQVEGNADLEMGETMKGNLSIVSKEELAFEVFSKTYPLQITSRPGDPLEASFASELVEIFLVLEPLEDQPPRGVFDYRDYETGIAVKGTLESAPLTDN